MKALLKRHPKTTIIWAHVGLGRIVHPVQAPQRLRREQTPIKRVIVEGILRPDAPPRVLRHQLGRGREVSRRDARDHPPRGRR